MKLKYTAKVYFEDGTIIENFGDHPEQLTTWMQGQAKVHSSQITGEIIDNTTHRVINTIQYDPLEDI